MKQKCLFGRKRHQWVLNMRKDPGGTYSFGCFTHRCAYCGARAMRPLFKVRKPVQLEFRYAHA